VKAATAAALAALYLGAAAVGVTALATHQSGHVLLGAGIVVGLIVLIGTGMLNDAEKPPAAAAGPVPPTVGDR
jgi:hypothetical protein